MQTRQRHRRLYTVDCNYIQNFKCFRFIKIPSVFKSSLTPQKNNESLANANRLCNCIVLGLCLKNSLYNCLHYSVHVDRTGHLRGIFRMEGGSSQQPLLEWKD